MNERIEAWKARERLRSDVIFPAASLGISGAVAIVIGFLAIAGVFQDLRPSQPPLFGLLYVLLGAGLLVCVVGLWNARPWARWTAVALSGLSLASIVQAGEFPKGALWPSFLIVYLLLPSTGRRFHRAQLLRQPSPERPLRTKRPAS